MSYLLGSVLISDLMENIIIHYYIISIGIIIYLIHYLLLIIIYLLFTISIIDLNYY